MSSTSVGFMLGRAFSHGKSPVLKALLETYIHGKYFNFESFESKIFFKILKVSKPYSYKF